jgi:hypothetical protein
VEWFPIGMPCKSSHATAAAENSRFALHAAHASLFRYLEKTAKLVVGCTLRWIGGAFIASRVWYGWDWRWRCVSTRCSVERGVRFVLRWLVVFVDVGDTGDVVCSG